ncbi:hypothetical protein A2524_03510 [Candidatus Wolfebacteria bacterium RIFOXYD12_FULL_48_21]|uniref:Uncharacterized protein n=1 Tax=Candidatus Wolfebacteria bacterium RIFOXYD1_FULL_48_65 TaxID=1802561 RepID=A0A1F8DYJ5_9BACT|nr:MAG: hypothetical protein A2610_00050 [Candidatus Wolfebacteria bacterium RIFOXYD1_FULL_48_65]OGM95125.1 MAG: hypothetical protein A2524_03510 [Candidatus Wolfebacteria bacterium RIFOXYD12_FULL_48_21]OGM97268.1 MAG: hypothetical protein A2532_03310 [Candidatus Wolfebacteria bacterium RIFOXYD2_FULL_48_11]
MTNNGMRGVMYLSVIPAEGGIQSTHAKYWIPVFTGMTTRLACHPECNAAKRSEIEGSAVTSRFLGSSVG